MRFRLGMGKSWLPLYLLLPWWTCHSKLRVGAPKLRLWNLTFAGILGWPNLPCRIAPKGD